MRPVSRTREARAPTDVTPAFSCPTAMSGNPRAIRLTLEAVVGRLLGIPASLSTDSKRCSDDWVGMVGGMSTNAEPRVANHSGEVHVLSRGVRSPAHNLGEAHGIGEFGDDRSVGTQVDEMRGWL
jgi:hypothetical protein